MTYSIVARDPGTGTLGVAVQSHWFSVGSVVPWAEAGVGAVATQSFAEPAYGPRGLALMRVGVEPARALQALVDVDPEQSRRQVGFVDARGRTATHTGDGCISAAGHATGEGVSVQANMMRSDAVWPAMLRAYEESAHVPFTERLMRTLEAAEKAGGDVRGRQSAAMLIVRAESSGQPWQDRLVDLRVEDSPAPLPELRRLLRVHAAYEHMQAAEEHEVNGDMARSLEEYEAARPLLDGNDEATFWSAILLADEGRVDEARARFADIVAREPGWEQLLRTLPRARLLRHGEDTVARLLGDG